MLINVCLFFLSPIHKARGKKKKVLPLDLQSRTETSIQIANSLFEMDPRKPGQEGRRARRRPISVCSWVDYHRGQQQLSSSEDPSRKTLVYSPQKGAGIWATPAPCLLRMAPGEFNVLALSVCLYGIDMLLKPEAAHRQKEVALKGKQIVGTWRKYLSLQGVQWAEDHRIEGHSPYLLYSVIFQRQQGK